MNLRKNIITALLIAIGFILRTIVPGTIGGMKFDLMLSVVFVSILINSEFKNVILTALLGGMLAAMTTTFPGGQLPNVIDKLITCIAVFFMIKVTSKFKFSIITVGVIAFLGTIVSGTVFLLSALYISGLPAPFTVLFIGIVLPTSITNIFATIVIHKAVNIGIKASGVNLIHQ